MPNKVWNIILDNQSYKVEVEHSRIRRKYAITINDKIIQPKERIILEHGDRLPFNIGSHSCNIIITLSQGFHYDLIIDGISTESNNPVELPDEWIPPKKGCLREILQFIFFSFLIGIISLIGWFITGVLDYEKTELFIILLMLVIVVVVIVRRGYFRKK